MGVVRDIIVVPVTHVASAVGMMSVLQELGVSNLKEASRWHIH